jgi:8-oxo-dGTP pyrophosphatase MutT (NUDIX family)
MSVPARWLVRHEALHVDCKVFRVFKEHCHHPLDKREGDFFVIHSHDWVLGLPITDDGKIVLVKQYRFGLRDLSIEPPGGLLEPGEDPIIAATREVEEETGFKGGKSTLLGSCSPNPAIQKNQCHFVLIEGGKIESAQDLDAHEEIEVLLVTPQEALDLAKNNPRVHALALLALYRLRDARPHLFS